MGRIHLCCLLGASAVVASLAFYSPQTAGAAGGQAATAAAPRQQLARQRGDGASIESEAGSAAAAFASGAARLPPQQRTNTGSNSCSSEGSRPKSSGVRSLVNTITPPCSTKWAAGALQCSSSDNLSGSTRLQGQQRQGSVSTTPPWTRAAAPSPRPAWQRTVASAVATAMLCASSMGVALPSFAVDAGDAVPGAASEIGVCVLNNCKSELASCLLNPKCLANLVCIQTCEGKADKTACQIKCGDLFENPVVGKFNACAVSQKRCVPQKQDDGSYPVPPQEALVKTFDTSIFNGRWYISAGLNKIFDTFSCQVHFFVNPAPGQVYGKLNWRITEPDGEFFTRDTVQRFVQDEKNPAILYNHNNEYLHYEDDWYILDAEPNSHILVYYRGQNDAWIGYGGAVLYTRSPSVPPEVVARVEAACERAGIKWSSFTLVDNSCEPQTRDAAFLRAEYSKRLLLLGEEQLAEQLTAVRGFAADKIQNTEKDAEQALTALEDLREVYQSELEFEALELQDLVGQELSELVSAAEAEAAALREGVVESVVQLEQVIESTLNVNTWAAKEAQTLQKLEQKLSL